MHQGTSMALQTWRLPCFSTSAALLAAAARHMVKSKVQSPPPRRQVLGISNMHHRMLSSAPVVASAAGWFWSSFGRFDLGMRIALDVMRCDVITLL
jgi:hypothetical protein